MRNCLTAAEDITERKRLLEILERNEAQLTAIFDSVPIILCLVDEHLEVVRMNQAMVRAARQAGPSDVTATALSVRSCLGEKLGCARSPKYLPPDKACTPCTGCVMREAIETTFKTSQPHFQVEMCFTSPFAQAPMSHALVSTALVQIEGRRMVTVAVEDITQRKELEARSLRAQRLDALGQLAGDLAHDYNNILSAILMNLDLLGQEEAGPEARRITQNLRAHAHRASTLTRQLLLFSRRETMRARDLDLNGVLNEFIKILRRLVRQNVQIELIETVDNVRIHADPGMIEQAVVNLCVNASDAMPEGGHLTLHTSRFELTALTAQATPGARPGSLHV